MKWPVFLTDEAGQSWVVYEDDPAAPLIKLLPKTVNYIVLTRKALMTGQVSTYPEPDFSALADSVITQPVAEVVKRICRCYDINSYLMSHFGGVKSKS